MSVDIWVARLVSVCPLTCWAWQIGADAARAGTAAVTMQVTVADPMSVAHAARLNAWVPPVPSGLRTDS
jgi:hypothetical protein